MRDVLHHVTDAHKFKDEKLVYRMRAADPPSEVPAGPTVPQLLNQSRFMLFGWFLKQVRPVCPLLSFPSPHLLFNRIFQGTVFLNRRFFVLDRLSRRLYVYTSDISASPRYCIDFTSVLCVVEGTVPVDKEAGTPPSAVPVVFLDEVPSIEAAMSPRSRSTTPAGPMISDGRRSTGSRFDDDPDRTAVLDMDTSPLDEEDVSSGKTYGINIRGPGVFMVAYASSLKQYNTWLKALNDAAIGRLPVSASDAPSSLLHSDHALL